MIFKASVIAEAVRNALHIGKQRNPDDPKTATWNDVVELVCSYNLVNGDNLRAAAREMEALASGGRARKPFFALAINPGRPGEPSLTDGQAEYVVRYLLEELGFSPEHQWLLVRHEKNGRIHFHVLANRIHPETMIAVRLSHNYRIQERVAREMECHFGLPVTPGVHVMPTIASLAEGPKPTRRKSRKIAEEQQSKKTGVPVDKVEDDLRWAWALAGNGSEFRERLAERGYALARGDRRDVIAIDEAGGAHSPTRRLNIPARVFREKAGDLKDVRLPTAAAVRRGLEGAERAMEVDAEYDVTSDPSRGVKGGFSP